MHTERLKLVFRRPLPKQRRIATEVSLSCEAGEQDYDADGDERDEQEQHDEQDEQEEHDERDEKAEVVKIEEVKNEPVKEEQAAQVEMLDQAETVQTHAELSVCSSSEEATVSAPAEHLVSELDDASASEAESCAFMQTPRIARYKRKTSWAARDLQSRAQEAFCATTFITLVSSEMDSSDES